MTETLQARTLQDQVYRRIRDEILNGRILPGARLKASELCKQYDVSLSVIREALTRLVEQRLVEREPQQSFAVAQVSPERLRHLVQVRIHVETLALRLAMEKGDVAWEGRVLAAEHALSRTPSRVAPGSELINEAWTAAHAHFHATLIEACGNPLLIELCRSLFDSSEVYRRWSLSLKRQLGIEHSKIRDAVLARDTERAVELLTQHFQLTANNVLEGLAEPVAG
jgi:GntR family transcriptional regulator, carbon starvation induced regulator